ncbi:MAG: MarR family transcriptional regulator [Burkholderiaceae bacterium]|nr:MarR family transcriptional regulator [Burkholderiaceae bacterium]
MPRTLGTLLRHLIELLDSAVERAYTDAGLDYRPRYTPVMRVLIRQGPATIGEIAESAAITQPAVTQTIGRMTEAGLVSIVPGVRDARQRIVQLTPEGQTLVSELERCWRATALAAQSLDQDLALPLGDVLEAAILALEKHPFEERIREARRSLELGS